MRWRGVSHVEFAVLHYDDSIAFYDALFGWLGYSSFSSLNMEYQSIYYMTRYVNPHSYVGIEPGAYRREADAQRPGDRHQSHCAMGAQQKKVDRFHCEFLIERDIAVTDEPRAYPEYWPGLRSVLRRPDQRDSLGVSVGAESAYARQVWSFYRALRIFTRSRPDLANSVPGVTWQARRTLPSR